jgi:hypothetical protein
MWSTVNRAQLFAVMLALSVGTLLVALLWYLEGYQSGNGSISGVMGQMMGGPYGSGAMASMPSYVWGGLLALVVLIAVAVGGLAYYVAVPEIKTAAAPLGETPFGGTAKDPPVKTGAPEDWGVLIRTSKPEERKVLEVLAAHNGRYLQKFVVKESGLSRLKTHRIISRLAERGVVTAVQSGNTNEISLASWLVQPQKAPSPQANPAG